MLLQDRIVVVTGVGPGLGRAIVLGCAREGADIVLAARSKDVLEDVATEVEALGGTATIAPTDVTDAQSIAALADTAVAAHGHVDVVVNNAFVQPPLEHLVEATPETWRQAFEVNLFGAVAVTNAFVPHLAASDHAAVVFTASMSARRVRRRFAVYSATKSALLTTMQHYANELGRDGIRCNAIVPGYVWGPNLEAWFGWQAKQRGVDPEVIYDEVASETALHHLPTSAEVADAVVFLASDLSRAITGVGLDVNAGNWFH